jgi:hypothetical protein
MGASPVDSVRGISPAGTPERTGLGETEVVGVRRLAAAQETRLLGDIAQVLPVAIATRGSNREDASCRCRGVAHCGGEKLAA